MKPILNTMIVVLLIGCGIHNADQAKVATLNIVEGMERFKIERMLTESGAEWSYLGPEELRMKTSPGKSMSIPDGGRIYAIVRESENSRFTERMISFEIDFNAESKAVEIRKKLKYSGT